MSYLCVDLKSVLKPLSCFKSPTVLDSFILSLESCIADVQSWFVANCLMINDTKTEFLIIGSSYQLAKMAINSIIIGESSFQSVQNETD